MIKNFSDHAANERTFLAWVRTAIAVMAFIVIGTVMIILAAARLFVTARKIDSDISHAGIGSQLDIALAVLLALLGGSLFLYLSHALVASL